MFYKIIFLLFFSLTSQNFLFSMVPKSDESKSQYRNHSYTLNELRKKHSNTKLQQKNSTSSRSFKQEHSKKYHYEKNAYQSRHHKFIYDNYTIRRGTPQMLDIFCDDCDEYLMSYQKDGPGRLLRCYLDRIHRPGYLKELQYKHFDVRFFPNLVCENCRLIIGRPMMYQFNNQHQFESRAAYKMLEKRFYFRVDK